MFYLYAFPKSLLFQVAGHVLGLTLLWKHSTFTYTNSGNGNGGGRVKLTTHGLMGGGGG